MIGFVRIGQTHARSADSVRTLCGIMLTGRRWTEVRLGDELPTCSRCRRYRSIWMRHREQAAAT
jgi:hypothetical protein